MGELLGTRWKAKDDDDDDDGERGGGEERRYLEISHFQI